MNNLKGLSMDVFIYIFLGRKLTWIQWKAFIILMTGSTVIQLSVETDERGSDFSSPMIGYALVVIVVL